MSSQIRKTKKVSAIHKKGGTVREILQVGMSQRKTKKVCVTQEKLQQKIYCAARSVSGFVFVLLAFPSH